MTKLCAVGAHQNVVEVFRHGAIADSALYYIDMELCNGDLAGYIADHPPGTENGITMVDVWNVIIQITNGLVYVHDKGEVHRDLRPHNSTAPFDSCHLPNTIKVQGSF